MAAILRKQSKDHHHHPPSKPVDGRCKKHPKHRQTPGVCSLCLTEKLSQLMTNPTTSRRTNSTTTAGSSGSSTSSSLSSYYSSSSDSSACSSPMQQYRCHRYRNYNNIINIGREGRVASNSMSAFLFSGGNNVLKKSRSLAFGHRSTRRTDCEDDDQKRKTGFLSRLLIPQGNNNKRTTKAQRTFMHSRTVRESVH